MKKLLLFLAILISLPCFAADKLHVKALEDYNSLNPKETFKVKLLESAVVDEIFILDDSIINCSLLKVKDAKRAKRDAKVYFQLISYEDMRGVHNFAKKLTARYSKTILNKEKIKQIPPKKIVKTAASVAGGAVVEGFGAAVSFVDGVIVNEEENRLKSGVKQVYKDSVLSYVEYGDVVDIKEGDIFYFIVKPTKKRDMKEEKTE